MNYLNINLDKNKVSRSKIFILNKNSKCQKINVLPIIIPTKTVNKIFLNHILLYILTSLNNYLLKSKPLTKCRQYDNEVRKYIAPKISNRYNFEMHSITQLVWTFPFISVLACFPRKMANKQTK